MQKKPKKKSLSLAKKTIVSFSEQVKVERQTEQVKGGNITITFIPYCSLSFMVSCIDAW
ncbi:hypothetical protein [Taibaiella chishuiensis]|uniref:Uncharacterized protein n=1 Tax=Taibaiella chishuiensis TaxID=1434707 RepID=A0A2P8CXW5_9BACT|nr:hypothetical protein [Taibaiella chishuiensis]PSK89777.1 hypothetical protein B0I18_11076 [Taibaiella chishuiensis]